MIRKIEAIAPFEKFEIPYQFQPRLSLYGGIVAIMGAMTRILLGSLFGALWGVAIWSAAASHHAIVLKCILIPIYAAGLTLSMTALMWAVTKTTKILDPSSAPPVL